MQISMSMLTKYLFNLFWYTDMEGDVPDNFSVYDEDIERIRDLIKSYHDEEPWRLGVDYLLGNPWYSTEHLIRNSFPYENDEIQRVLLYMRKKLWPDAGPVPLGGPPGVKLIATGLREWWDSRAALREQAQKEGCQT